MEQYTRTAYVLFLAGAFLWCLLIFLPPIDSMASHPPGWASSLSYRFFSTICHEQDARSFHVAGIRLAACSRCTAIYVSFLLGILFWRPLSRAIPADPSLWWAAALLPMLADIMLDVLDLHTSGFLSRSLTGGTFGFIAGMILTPLFLKASAELQSPLSHHQGMKYESQT